MTKSRPHHRRGFTLIEAIATITILAALGTVASTMVLTATTSWRDAAVTAQLHDELSTALERIAKELRAIGPDPAAPGPDPAAPGPAPRIASLTATSIAYDASSSLTLTGGNLRLVDDGAPAVTLLSDVSALSIRAFDDTNTQLAASLAGASCLAIRRIEVTITLARQGVSHTLRTRIYLRATMTGTAP